jgi:hypothetical protein
MVGPMTGKFNEEELASENDHSVSLTGSCGVEILRVLYEPQSLHLCPKMWNIALLPLLQSLQRIETSNLYSTGISVALISKSNRCHEGDISTIDLAQIGHRYLRERTLVINHKKSNFDIVTNE